MARYVVPYNTYNWAVADVGITHRFNLPLVRACRALILHLTATATGALVDQSPESMITKILVRADTHVIVDMDGAEAWILSSMLGFATSPKDVSVITTPCSTIVIPFGERYALDLPSYKQVSVELTFATAITRGAATTFPTLAVRTLGIEQDDAPIRTAKGGRLGRRFLRSQFTMAAGDVVCQLPETEAYNGLLLCALDACDSTVFTLDQNWGNITNITAYAEIPGNRLRLLDGVDYKALCDLGQFEGGIGQGEAALAIGATLYKKRFVGVAYCDLSNSGGERPLDLPGLKASKLTVLPTATGATQLSIVRDTIVEG